MKKFLVRISNILPEKNSENSDSLYSSLMVILGTFLVFLLVVVSISQIGLLFVKSRQYLTNVDVLEGAISVGSQSYIDKGTLTMTLLSGKPSEKIEILVNGEVVDNFNEKIKTIDIMSQSVIEIKAPKDTPIEVELTNISDTLKTVLNNEKIYVKGIEVLCRVVFK